MKFYLLITGFFLISICNETSIYSISLQTIDGNNVSLSSYQGKKLIIIEFNAQDPASGQLQYFDSLHMLDNIRVVAVPAVDFGEINSVDQIKNMRDSLNLHLVITMPSAVKRTSGAEQHPLFNWLTHVNSNGHFDNDVEETGQIFIIGAQGTLYSLLKKETPHSVIAGALNQQIN